MALVDPYEAYCFDEAVQYVGTHIQGQLDEVKTPKGKNGEKRRKEMQQELLMNILSDAPKKPKFRDPADMLRG